jgi:hypothetical protein
VLAELSLRVGLDWVGVVLEVTVVVPPSAIMDVPVVGIAVDTSDGGIPLGECGIFTIVLKGELNKAENMHTRCQCLQ